MNLRSEIPCNECMCKHVCKYHEDMLALMNSVKAIKVEPVFRVTVDCKQFVLMRAQPR